MLDHYMHTNSYFIREHVDRLYPRPKGSSVKGLIGAPGTRHITNTLDWLPSFDGQTH